MDPLIKRSILPAGMTLLIMFLEKIGNIKSKLAIKKEKNISTKNNFLCGL